MNLLSRDGIQMVAANSSILAHAGGIAGGYSALVPPDPAHQIKRPRIDPRGASIAPLSIDTRDSVKVLINFLVNKGLRRMGYLFCSNGHNLFNKMASY